MILQDLEYSVDGERTEILGQDKVQTADSIRRRSIGLALEDVEISREGLGYQSQPQKLGPVYGVAAATSSMNCYVRYG